MSVDDVNSESIIIPFHLFLPSVEYDLFRNVESFCTDIQYSSFPRVVKKKNIVARDVKTTLVWNGPK